MIYTKFHLSSCAHCSFAEMKLQPATYANQTGYCIVAYNSVLNTCKSARYLSTKYAGALDAVARFVRALTVVCE